MEDRRKENHPVLIDRRKRPDSIVHRAVTIFLQKALTAHRFVNCEEVQLS